MLPNIPTSGAVDYHLLAVNCAGSEYRTRYVVVLAKNYFLVVYELDTHIGKPLERPKTAGWSNRSRWGIT